MANEDARRSHARRDDHGRDVDDHDDHDHDGARGLGRTGVDAEGRRARLSGRPTLVACRGRYPSPSSVRVGRST